MTPPGLSLTIYVELFDQCSPHHSPLSRPSVTDDFSEPQTGLRKRNALGDSDAPPPPPPPTMEVTGRDFFFFREGSPCSQGTFGGERFFCFPLSRGRDPRDAQRFVIE